MFRFCAPILLSDNSHLGRFNPTLLSDQQCLELLVSEMETRASFQDDDGDFLECSKWRGLYRANGHIRIIDWFFENRYCYLKPISPGGTIALEWIPQSVERFSVRHLQLNGSIETALLPRGIRRFNVESNQLTGPFDTAGLPPSIEQIRIHSNQLCGTINIPALPHAVCIFMAQRNTFSGGLDFSRISKMLKEVHLQGNQFSGPLQLDDIQSIEMLDLRDNCFRQSLLRIPIVHPQFQDGVGHTLHIDMDQFDEVVYTKPDPLRYQLDEIL